MKTGITGATGQLGQLVVEQLKKRTNADDVVALVRNTDKAASLGIEARVFDYAKPDLLEDALKGIDHLLLISGNEFGQRVAQHINVINAAKAAGVKRIVYTSVLHADKSSLSLAPDHFETEQALKSSGIPYTILRNAWYTENYTGFIKGAIASGALVGGAGEGKISSAARADYAEAAAVVLTTQGHEGKTYELAGDNAYTLAELAAEISRQAGKDIPYNNLPEEKYATILQQFGFPDFLAKAFASWDTSVSKNDLFNDSKQLSTLIGHATTPLAVSVQQALV